MSATCARGCTIRGLHTPGEGCDKTCTGCLPREAEFGQLCTSCHGHLTRALYQAPDLVEYLRELEAGQDDSTRVDGTREAPIPLNAGAVDAADDLHAMLCSWVLLILEEHPDKLKGPDARGSRITEPSKRKHLADRWRAVCADEDIHLGYRTTRKAAFMDAGEHVDLTGHVVTVTADEEHRWTETTYSTPQVAGLMPDADTGATRNITAWLLARQEWCERQEWAAVMVNEVTGVVATLMARYPEREAEHHVDGVTCLACGRMTLTYHPPVTFEADFIVQCDHHACSAIIPEQHWGLYLRRVVDELGPAPKLVYEPKHLVSTSDGYGGAA